MLKRQFSAAIFGALALASIADCAQAQAQEVVRVGLQEAEPGVIRNNSQLGGRDIEMWDAIAKDARLRLTYVIMNNVPTLLAAMAEGKMDVVGTGVSRTPDMQSKYHLTDSLFMTAEALVVPTSDTRAYRGLDDIKGLNFATLKASTYANYLKQVGITGFKEFDTIPDILGAVSSGQANAALFSGIIAGYLLKQGKFPDLRIVTSYQPALSRPIMAAFPKSATESYNKFNASIQKLTADGTMRRILAHYGQ